MNQEVLVITYEVTYVNSWRFFQFDIICYMHVSVIALPRMYALVCTLLDSISAAPRYNSSLLMGIIRVRTRENVNEIAITGMEGMQVSSV